MFKYQIIDECEKLLMDINDIQTDQNLVDILSKNQKIMEHPEF